jgi:DNA mismatch repair protein MutL
MMLPEQTSKNRINRLDNRLANQIAAGEVVERPSSVVKELLENSIDAKASRIEVDIERGGTRLIRVTDNGCGIVKDDLSLALSRHATSKISNSNDLASINSLGFRGEALASIGSVSRLCLTSRIENSDFAWQAIAEGRNMTVDIQPASSTVGTRIEVRDLFYNTPARQKFLRAEKTEFSHIEEIFKRHALVNFETAFILKHNQKVVKRVPATSNTSDASHTIKRIESICGKPFADNSISFNCQHDALDIKGWLGKPSYHRSESDIQYVFINGRPVKDKMLNHAIRQSYQGLLPPGRMPTFVIFLEIDPTKIDVNVHPTKHEVRFDEQRLVHDLLVKSISDALSDNQTLLDGSLIIEEFNTKVELLTAPEINDMPSSYSFNKPLRNRSFGVAASQVSYSMNTQVSSNTSTSLNTPISLGSQSSSNSQKMLNDRFSSKDTSLNNLHQNKINLNDGFWIVFNDQQAYVFNEEKLFQNYLHELMNGNAHSYSKPLLFPKTTPIDLCDIEEVETVTELNRYGFVFEPNDDDSILLKELPTWLNGFDKEVVFQYFPSMVKILASKEKPEYMTLAIYQQLKPLPNNLIDFLINHQLTQGINDEILMLMTAGIAKGLLK